MRFKFKLIGILMSVGLLPSLIISMILLNTATESITQNKFDQLLSLKEVKRQSVNRYLQTIQDQAATMAVNPTVIESVQLFGQKFDEIKDQSSRLEEDKFNRLKRYYTNEFATLYKERNPESQLNISNIMAKLDQTTLLMQSTYIADNPNPLGEKHLFIQASNGSEYDEIHAKYHEYFKYYLESFSYYDIFLIDLSGNVVYSVFKELDFATSLVDGPYRSSGLAKAFKEAKQLGKRANPVFVDFAQYFPSYESPAGFIAAPVFMDDNLVGVIAFQFPIDALNKIMSDREGLGQTGETYLVGSDLLMRSDSYLDPENHSVEASFRQPEKGKVETQASKNAIKGTQGVEIIIDYNNNPVLSAYAPLGFEGFNWAIIAEIDEAEVLADVKNMQGSALVILLLALGLMIIIALYVTNLVMTPLGAEPILMEQLAARIAEGNLDTPQPNASDTGAYKSLLLMGQRLRSMVSNISQAADQQASAAEELSSITHQTSKTLDNQKEQIEMLATAMNEMTASFQEVSSNTIDASDASKEARNNVSEGASQVLNTAREVDVLSSNLHDAKIKVKDLKQYADNIASILQSIKGIADQTNLLALNAAIEAARAGDQGRGFAVVADEVRSLAQNTQNATEEIAQMIQTLQQSSDSASNVIDRCVNTMSSVSTRAMTTSKELKVAVDSANKIDDMMNQIASASEEQAAVADEINQKVVEINSISLETHESASQIRRASQELARLSSQLHDLVSFFRT